MHTTNHDITSTIDHLYRQSSRQLFATLIRLLGDFDLADEALHEAFRAAIEKWPTQGIPSNPHAWLVSAGRFNLGKAQSFRKASIAEGVLRRMVVDHGEQSLPYFI